MYPSRADPASGVFVEQQVRSLQALGVEVDVLHLDRTGLGPRAYVGLPAKLRHAIERTRPTVVDVAYGGVMAARVTEAVRNRPVVVHYRGSDLLGSRAEPLLRRMAISAGVRTCCARRPVQPPSSSCPRRCEQQSRPEWPAGRSPFFRTGSTWSAS